MTGGRVEGEQSAGPRTVGEPTGLEVCGLPVRTDATLPPRSAFLISTDRHGLPRSAVGIVGGKVAAVSRPATAPEGEGG